MAVEPNLQPERSPSRYADVSQAQLWIDKIEIVVEAFAGGQLHAGLAGWLVIPGRILRAGFHRRDDVDQARHRTALRQDLRNDGLFADMAVLQILDLEPVLGGDILGVLAHLLTQRIQVLAQIETPDAGPEKHLGHRFRVGHRHQGPRQHQPIVAPECPHHLVGVTAQQTIVRTHADDVLLPSHVSTRLALPHPAEAGRPKTPHRPTIALSPWFRLRRVGKNHTRTRGLS